MTDNNTLVVQAWADIADDTHTQWKAATVSDNSPYAGLYAFGQSFAEAREALASLVWAAVNAGIGNHNPANIDAVRILATTRKTFPTAPMAT